jgi:hypothetical protein
LLDGKGLAARIRQEIAAEAQTFQMQTGVTPHLAAVLVGDNPASAVYVRNKQRACEQAGLRSTLHQLPQDATASELLDLVAGLNHDPGVHGILVQLPLPPRTWACSRKADPASHPVHPQAVSGSSWSAAPPLKGRMSSSSAAAKSSESPWRCC